MSAGLFAKKVGMTQVFDESGIISPVTILRAELCKVSQIKTLATDGYNAIQVAYGEEKLEKLKSDYYLIHLRQVEPLKKASISDPKII